MAEPSPAPERRLSAVLFADMVDYSSLRQEDALRFQAEMMALARTLLAHHQGRLVKSLGDGFIAEFGAASAAVGFGLELQESIDRRNAPLPSRERFHLRLGVNAGEVWAMDGDDVGGTTVNVAARAEPLALPGGLCLTETVWQQVREQVPRPADRLGRLRVKGLRRPIVFYHLPPATASWWARQRQRWRLQLGSPTAPAGFAVVGGCLVLAALLAGPHLGRFLEHWFPPTPTERVERARALLDRYDLPHHLERALADLREAVRLDPSLTEAHAHLGLAHWRRYKLSTDVADRSEAWMASSNALTRNPDTMLGHFVQGLVALDENRLPDATNALARANDAAPWENAEVMIELATACQRSGDQERARLFAERASRARQQPWSYFNARGRFEFGQGDAAAAVAAFRQATTQAPDSPVAWANLGLVLESLDQPAEARPCFEQSLRLSPTAWAYDGLGTHYLAQGNWLAAATNFQQAAQLNPVRYDLPGKAGLAWLHLPDRRAQAEELLQLAADKAQARLKRAGDPRAQANLGLYLAGLGRDQEAEQIFASLTNPGPASPVLIENISAAIEVLDQRGQRAASERLRNWLDRLRAKSE